MKILSLRDFRISPAPLFVVMVAGLLAMINSLSWAELTHVFAVNDPIEGLPGVKAGQIHHASLTSGGGVVATVTLSGTGVTSANQKALVTAAPGAPVQLMARDGAPVTGAGIPAGSTIANIFYGSTSVEASDTGVVARHVQIDMPGNGVVDAILAGGPGSLSVQVYLYQSMPELGPGETIGPFCCPQINRRGDITYATGGKDVIWRGVPGAMAMVAIEQTQYGELPGAGKFSGFSLPVINDTGDLCFGGSLVLDGAVVTGANDQRLWKAGPPFVQLMVEGQTLPDGGVPSSFSAVAMRGSWALFSVAVPGGGRLAIMQPGSTPHVIMRERSDAPDANGNVIAPFIPGVWQADSRLLPAGIAVFNRTLLSGGAINDTNNQGIWRWNGSTLRLLAREGSDIPNLPGRRWTTMPRGLIHDSGRGVFSAAVTGPSPSDPGQSTWSGVWWAEDGNAPELLAEYRHPIALTGGAAGEVLNYGPVWSVKDSNILVSGVQVSIAGGGTINGGVAVLNTTATPTTGTIRGEVRVDYDDDGDPSDPDPGAAGVTFQLFASDGAGNPTGPVLKTYTSVANGTYGFDEVAPGPYVVRGVITPAQTEAGLSWTVPATNSSSVEMLAEVAAGETMGDIDFLVTTPIRPDHFSDENDGDAGLNRQSLREALDRATKKSRPVTIDLKGGVYSLSSDPPLKVDGPNTFLITLRNSIEGFAVLDSEGTGRILSIEEGSRFRAERLSFVKGNALSGGAVDSSGEFYALRCEFLECSATAFGGAISSWGGTTLESCKFEKNSSRGEGGAVAVYEGTCRIINSLLINNAAGSGGAIDAASGTLEISHSSIIRNYATEAGGLMVRGLATARLKHCLMGINSNEDESGDVVGAIHSLGFNLIQWNDTLTGTLQSSDIVGESPEVGEGGLLLPESPAIDAGDPAFDPAALPLDVTGKARMVGGRIDIGAVEFSGTPVDWTMAYFSRAVADDPAKEATDWGAAADPDKDGVVNTLERAFGGDPTTSAMTLDDGSALLPAVQKLAAAVDFKFALDERYTDLRYIVQTSRGAAPWLDAATFVPLGGGMGFRRDPAPGAPTNPGSSSSSRSRFLINEMLPIQPGERNLLRLKVIGGQ